MSYGGKKLSGLGSEYSIEGALEGFTQRKSITVGLGIVNLDPVGVRGRPGAGARDPGRQRTRHRADVERARRAVRARTVARWTATGSCSTPAPTR